MKWVSVAFLILSWSLWLLARFAGLDNLSGWTFVVSYIGLAVGLMLAASMTGALQGAIRLIGGGFLLLAIGEFGWLTLFSDGESGGSVILPNLPYVFSSALFALAAYLIYTRGVALFGFQRRWVLVSLLLAVGIVVALSSTSFDPNALALASLLDHADNILSGFASLLLVTVALLTAGGSWSRWMIPLAVGFAFRMLGNIYYSITSDTYAYGSAADWLWLLGSTAAAMFTLQSEEHEALPAAAD